MSGKDEGTDAAEHFIDVATDVTGGMASAALGLVVAGPPGALGGAAAGPLITRSLKYVARELRQRLLGPREEIRVGTALTYAAATVRDRLDGGEHLRTDAFFEAAPGERPDADEVVEGVLLAAQRSYEERKVPYYGRLLAGIGFESSVTRAEANHLLQTFEAISYQQFVLLQVFGVQGLARALHRVGGGAV